MTVDTFSKRQEFKILNIRKVGLVETSFYVCLNGAEFWAQTDFLQKRLSELKNDRAKGDINILGGYKHGHIKTVPESYNIDYFYDERFELWKIKHMDGFVLKKDSNRVFLKSKFDVMIHPVSKDDIDKFQEGDFIRIEEPSLWIHNIEPL